MPSRRPRSSTEAQRIATRKVASYLCDRMVLHDDAEAVVLLTRWVTAATVGDPLGAPPDDPDARGIIADVVVYLAQRDDDGDTEAATLYLQSALLCDLADIPHPGPRVAR